MTLYGYARVSVREPEDKNLDLQVERLVRAGCSLGNIRAEEASGARNDRGGLLELLDLVVEGDTLVVTHIDRLSRGLTHGLQVIEGPAPGGEWSSGLCPRILIRPRPPAKLQLTMVLAFSEWCLRGRRLLKPQRKGGTGPYDERRRNPYRDHHAAGAMEVGRDGGGGTPGRRRPEPRSSDGRRDRDKVITWAWHRLGLDFEVNTGRCPVFRTITPAPPEEVESQQPATRRAPRRVGPLWIKL